MEERFLRMDERFHGVDGRFRSVDESIKAASADMGATFGHELRTQATTFDQGPRTHATTFDQALRAQATSFEQGLRTPTITHGGRPRERGGPITSLALTRVLTVWSPPEPGALSRGPGR